MEIVLPNDICRCHDDGCAYHLACVRWLDKNRGSGKWISQCGSLYPYDQPLGHACPSFIGISCSACEKGHLEIVEADEPFHGRYFICSDCDSTYPLEFQREEKENDGEKDDRFRLGNRWTLLN